MDTSIEDTIKERFVSFYKAMNYWYLYCNNLEDDETLTDLEITTKKKRRLRLFLINIAQKRKEKMDFQMLYRLRFFF